MSDDERWIAALLPIEATKFELMFWCKTYPEGMEAYKALKPSKRTEVYLLHVSRKKPHRKGFGE